MDPHLIYDVTTENLRLNLYDHLYRYLDNPPKITPWLAESYNVGDEGGNGRSRSGKGPNSITATR